MRCKGNWNNPAEITALLQTHLRIVQDVINSIGQLDQSTQQSHAYKNKTNKQTKNKGM